MSGDLVKGHIDQCLTLTPMLTEPAEPHVPEITVRRMLESLDSSNVLKMVVVLGIPEFCNT